jgi:lysophospholipase L1-like esterase
MPTPRPVGARVLSVVVGCILAAGLATAAEFLLTRLYYSRTYSYYEAAAVYWEDQHTLLLYLPDRLLFWTLRPGVRLKARERIESYGPSGLKVGHERAWEVAVGPKGFRGADFPWVRPARELRVGCLGDSRTLGEGLAGPETYPEQLSRRLTARLRGRPVRVLNLGADGWSSFQGLRLLEGEAARASLSVAVFAFGVNDTDVDWGISDVEMARRLDSPMVSIRRALYRSMIFYGSAHEFLQIKGALFGKTPVAPGPALGPDGHPRVSRDEFGRNVARFADICRARSILPIVITLPLNPYYDWGQWAPTAVGGIGGYAEHRANGLDLARRGDLRAAQAVLREATETTVFGDYSRTARDVARSLSVRVVDPTLAFDDAQVNGHNPYVDPMHPSPSGASIMAEELSESIGEGSGIDRGSGH